MHPLKGSHFGLNNIKGPFTPSEPERESKNFLWCFLTYICGTALQTSTDTKTTCNTYGTVCFIWYLYHKNISYRKHFCNRKIYVINIPHILLLKWREGVEVHINSKQMIHWSHITRVSLNWILQNLQNLSNTIFGNFENEND